MTRAELLSKISVAELIYWRVIYEKDPWLEKRSDIQTGTICSAIFNAVPRDPKKPGKKAKIRDFLPDYWREVRDKASKEVWNWFKGFAKRHNERIAEDGDSRVDETNGR